MNIRDGSVLWYFVSNAMIFTFTLGTPALNQKITAFIQPSNMKSFCFVTPEKYLKTVERLFLTATDKAEVPSPYFWSLQLRECESVKRSIEGTGMSKREKGRHQEQTVSRWIQERGEREIPAHCHTGVTDWVKNNDCILVQWQLDISEYTNT